MPLVSYNVDLSRFYTAVAQSKAFAEELDAYEDILGRAAGMVVSALRASAPKQSGALAESISAEMSGNSFQIMGNEYGLYTSEGTSALETPDVLHFFKPSGEEVFTHSRAGIEATHWIEDDFEKALTSIEGMLSESGAAEDGAPTLGTDIQEQLLSIWTGQGPKRVSSRNRWLNLLG